MSPYNFVGWSAEFSFINTCRYRFGRSRTKIVIIIIIIIIFDYFECSALSNDIDVYHDFIY